MAAAAAPSVEGFGEAYTGMKGRSAARATAAVKQKNGGQSGRERKQAQYRYNERDARVERSLTKIVLAEPRLGLPEQLAAQS